MNTVGQTDIRGLSVPVDGESGGILCNMLDDIGFEAWLHSFIQSVVIEVETQLKGGTCMSHFACLPIPYSIFLVGNHDFMFYTHLFIYFCYHQLALNSEICDFVLFIAISRVPKQCLAHSKCSVNT